MKTDVKAAYTAGPVPKEAVDYFRAKGWKVGFDYRDVWKEEHAHAFTVAKAMEIDVLESIRGAVDKVIAEGKPFAAFKKELQPELEKLGWWGKKEMVDPKTGETRLVQLGSPRRLQVIFRQNLRSAQAVQQWQTIEKTKKTQPWIEYRLGPSEKHRKEHVEWDGMVLSSDDPFWDTHFPPNGWGCKCWIRQRRTLPDGQTGASPPVRYRKWQNPRTGEIEEVPEGITPGFDFNPGKARQPEQLKRFAERLDTGSQTAAEAVHRAWMQPEIFGPWRKAPQGSIPVAAVDEVRRAALGAETRTMLLDADRMAWLEIVLPDLTDAQYCLLPEILSAGTVAREGSRSIVRHAVDGIAYEAVLEGVQLVEFAVLTE